ncbi:AAA family ATPase [Clostridium felsineum]|uniref:AAA family ATPase n=1 Tax=Clostridium felsineum TaxID=36839 RepID=UPI00098BF066|nr:AAA family ATPase [Clostridium felsineum]URZ15815.1 hypothetical protein CLFE_018620 [Clostridium felsineum DSM 794]
MRIKYIHVKNFRSFDDQVIDFEKLNILIGANAAGKSNTIEIFRFINNIINYGLENAFALMGGINYAVNASIGRYTPIYIKFELDLSDEKWIRNINEKTGHLLQLCYVRCEFEICCNKRGMGFKISKDKVKIGYKCVEIDSKKVKEDEFYYNLTDKSYEVIYEKVGNRVKLNVSNQSNYEDKKLEKGLGASFICNVINEEYKTKKELIINKLAFMMPPMFMEDDFIRIYDFEPKLMKQSSSLTTIRKLKEDGSNLASILQIVLRNKKDKKLLMNLLSDCLPFIEDISVENNIDKSVSYKIKENFNSKNFYSNFLSDGTVNILALTIALYFQKDTGIIIIEEPERNLHPQLMRKIIELAKDKSINKQIIITTHNSEFVKNAELDSLLFAKRKENGFTSISKPVNDEKVKIFLDSELGIDDLFVKGILEE